ncbi:MAG: Rpn family recombination-promoting nuclease/putative transposase [Methanobrevibacter sp. CfCl-M3]
MEKTPQKFTPSLNHEFYKDEKEIYRYNYKITNQKSLKIFNNGLLDIHIFEKVNKKFYNANDPLDLFLMYLHGLFDEKELKELMKKDEFIRDVEEERLMISKSIEAEILKISIDKAERDQLSTLNTAKRKAQKEGMEKGVEKGIEKGRKEGKEEAMFEVAKKLKSAGETFQRINGLNGIPIEKIKNI